MAERGKAAKMLPEYKVFEKKYDKIRMIEEECPGVYYIFTEGLRNGSTGSEFYAVMRDTPVISAQAKSYGIPLSDASKVLIYRYQDYFDKGWHVVEYEIHKYLSEQGLPLPDGASLPSEAVFGMEICPEYFGAFPVPEQTPWGKPVECIQINNGFFWVRTEEKGWTLAISYPGCTGLPEKILEAAALNPYDRENGIDNTMGYRFFLPGMDGISIFQLAQSAMKPGRPTDKF